MFAVAELNVWHVRVGRETHVRSLSEIPLVLALVFASPGVAALGRCVGPLAVYVLQRRQPPVKILYNVVQQTASAAAAGAAYELVRAGSSFPDPRAVVAVYAGVLAASLVDGVALRAVIGLYEGSLRRRPQARDLVRSLRYPPVSLMVATFAVVASYALQYDRRSVVPLLGCAASILLAYRAYSGLSGRHLTLERLYQFSQAFEVTPETEHVLSDVLARANDLLGAQYAEVVFLSSDGEPGVTVGLDPGRRLRRGDGAPGPLPRHVRESLVGRGVPVLLPRGTRDPVLRDYLDARGWREAILAPLRSESGVTAVIAVAERVGDMRTFDLDDALLLETVAGHAGVALQNGQLIDRLRHEALHDPLTGLPNRVTLQSRVTAALEPSLGLDGAATGDGARAAGSLAVMIMDLDGFKEVNDTLGHHLGDQLLVEVAERLRVAAGPEALVARLGGDEFAVLLDPCADTEYARQLGKRLLASLEQPVCLEGLEVAIGGSLGIALAPDHANDMASLLKRADLAMYAAKASTSGLNLFDVGMDTRSPRRLALTGELRQALFSDELRVHVQPKVRLATGDIVAVEALVRWQHPTQGLLYPDDFVPMAERSGLSRQLTLQVLDTTLAASASWHRAGFPVGVAVNLSPRNLLDPDLVPDVARLLRRHEVPPSMLVLEITEGAVMADPALTIDVLHQLRELGVALSVDDFGTGYSSLSYLKRLPVDEVKIDNSFVRRMGTDADDAAIVRSIVDLGHHLSLAVVAEGIENEEIAASLETLGCGFGQGFHLGRPMPVGDFLPWLCTRLGVEPEAPVGVPLPSAPHDAAADGGEREGSLPSAVR